MMTDRMGQKIKALRLGYAFSSRLSAWVRISDFSHDRYLVELVPSTQILPSRPAGANVYRDIKGCADDILDHIPLMKRVVRVKKQLSFVVNNDGEIVA